MKAASRTGGTGRPFLRLKRKRGRPPKIDPYGGILQSVLSAKEKKSVGAPPVLEPPDLFRLIADVAIHRRGGHDNKNRSTSDALRWAARSGLYEDQRSGKPLTYKQLHDAYYNALSNKGFRDKTLKFFGKELFGRPKDRRRRKRTRVF